MFTRIGNMKGAYCRYGSFPIQRTEKDASAPVIICATGKFIGEGFDDSRLDTLFLTMPISWQGTLAQYVGRFHRLHEEKHEVRVYDYIDSHAMMLEKMYQKRLKGYASLSYRVSLEQDAALNGDIIYDQHTFQEPFLRDISQAKASVQIVSPFITLKRVKWLESSLQQCKQRRVRITVATRTIDSLPIFSRKTAQIAVALPKELNCELFF